MNSLVNHFHSHLRSIAPVALLATALFLGAACSDDDDGDDGPTVTPTDVAGESPTPSPSPVTETPTTPATPTAPSPTVPSGATGDPELDPIVEAIDGDDPAEVADYVDYLDLECVEKVEGIGGPPQCPAGVPDGSPVSVLAMSSCEGYYVFEDTIEESLSQTLSADLVLYAAFEQTDPGTDVFPTGSKVLLFEESTTGFARMVNVEDGKIVSITSMCASTPEQVIEARSITDFILDPAA